MKVAAFAKYDRMAASTRQRMLQYVPLVEEAGMDVEVRPLLDNAYVRSLATGRAYSRTRLLQAYASRLVDLLRAPNADLLWVYAELFPYLPASFEKLVFRSGRPVVYDFDDAFFHQYDDNPNPLVRRVLRGKLEPLLRGAYACCCGNRYLRDYAVRHCPNSIVLPTVVDTAVYRPREENGEPGAVVVGWIGSPTTWPNVRPLLPLMRELCEDSGATFRVVGAGVAAERDRFPAMELVDWEEEQEVEQVRGMDVGIMPLLDLPFHRGKSGYKLIQYMGCALPVVASPVGVNSEIVRDGENGFLAASPDEWRETLARLVADADLRRRMGNAGRALVEEQYSLSAQAPRLIEVFRSAAQSSGL